MMEFTSKKTNYKKFLAVAFVSMMAFSLSNTVAFAKGEGEEIEREFTIDVTAPVVEKEETLEPVKEKENEFIVKDSNGNRLQNGDSVILIKDLKVKGSSIVLKKGTKAKNIRLIDADHDIDCKIDGFGAMKLKSSVVKKA